MEVNNLYINDQDFASDIGFNLESMHFNIEALACNNAQTHIIIDHRLKQLSLYNYDHKLYKLLGGDRNNLNMKTLSKLLDTDTKELILGYIDVVNKTFVHPYKYEDKNFYFSISFNINKNLCMNGLKLRLIPMIYTPDKLLYASLLLIEQISYIGEPVLEMFLTDERCTKLYDRVSRSFIREEHTQLSFIECDILRRSGEGEKESEIADGLDLSASSLKRLKQSIFDKLKVRTISEAIYIAYKKGLI